MRSLGEVPVHPVQHGQRCNSPARAERFERRGHGADTLGSQRFCAMPSDPPKAKSEEPLNESLAERLFVARTVVLFEEVTMASARRVASQLLALASDSREPIRLVINSPGGHVESADTIYDLIRFIDASVYVLGTGWVASAGALIFVAARKERRYCLKNTRFLLHQPLGGVGGPASDVEIEARQIALMRKRLNETFANATGQSVSRIERDTDRNYWLSAEEARDYGLVTHIVERETEFAKAPTG